MIKTPTILKKIVQRKFEEVLERSNQRSISELHRLVKSQAPCRGFVQAISNNLAANKSAVIAEIKKA
ncbi:MAG: indole-3-glycerol-phosphate synthase TrpC, partial [Spongiibacteraceae bacterium]|nr:indole-3-glycerol-phosphate synthase TrpC [Spongiibacteraceae bacterium]